MPAELLKSTQEKEKLPSSKIEALRSGELYTLESDAPALEVKESPSGSLSRLVSFELGTGKAGEEGPLHPDDPRVAVVDVWKDDNGEFLIAPRSLTTPEEINKKAWRIADLPKQQLPLGRSRNDLWEGVTGSPLPEQVSAQHLGIVLGEDRKLSFVDVGSTNGTRMEMALGPDITEALSAEKQAIELAKPLAESVTENKSLYSSEAIPGEEASVINKSASIHERLGVEPMDEEPVPEPEKNVAKNEELIQTLQAMKGGIDGWILTLRERPTMTSREHLEGVLAELAKQTAWLDEMTQKESDLELKSALGGLRQDMQGIESAARTVVSNIDQDIYRHGAEAHTDRVNVERQLEAYSNNLTNVFRKLIERAQATH